MFAPRQAGYEPLYVPSCGAHLPNLVTYAFRSATGEMGIEVLRPLTNGRDNHRAFWPSRFEHVVGEGYSPGPRSQSTPRPIKLLVCPAIASAANSSMALAATGLREGADWLRDCGTSPDIDASLLSPDGSDAAARLQRFRTSCRCFAARRPLRSGQWRDPTIFWRVHCHLLLRSYRSCHARGTGEILPSGNPSRQVREIQTLRKRG